MRLFKTPLLYRIWYPNSIWKKPSNESIYLTFDDGPSSEITPWVLNQLSTVNAKATFFCLGENLEKNEAMALEVLNCGHKLGNHTYSHLNGWKSTDKNYALDIARCDSILSALNVANPLFRPPYGKISRSQIRNIGKRNVVFWSHMAYDFEANLNIDLCLKKLKPAAPGSILVFHENAKSFTNLKRILPELLEHFTKRGLKIEAL